MNVVAPTNPRIRCEPSGFEIPLELIYTGTREGLNVWKSVHDVRLPQGTTSFTLRADVMPPATKIDVEVGQ